MYVCIWQVWKRKCQLMADQHKCKHKDKHRNEERKKQVSNLETSHEAIRETLHLFSPFKLITFQIKMELASQ